MQIHPEMLFAGRYLLKQRLGTGGYSEVWLGEDKKSRDIQVALKIFAPGSGLDERGLELFSGEYSLVFNLQHPGLLKPMHYDDFEGMPFFVMQYMSNGSCEGLIGKSSEPQLAEFMLQTSKALEYLHDQDPPIIHLDIKPENILINNNGKYLLADFGISTKIRKTLTRSIGGDQTKSGGTPAYMAPERISKNLQERLPIRANDIFSLGVTMFEMLCGELPYGEMGGAIAASGIEPPDLPDTYDKALNRILHLCIAREPYNRPTAAELRSAAESFLHDGKWIVPERLDVSAISEKDAWEKAAQNNNTELLKSFIKAFPNSVHLSDAHQRLEIVLWKNAMDQDSVVAYSDYLTNFENGDHAESARLRMEDLDWKEVLRRSSDEALHNFLVKYPNSKYKADAMQMLNPPQDQPPMDEFKPPVSGNPTIVGPAASYQEASVKKSKKWVLPVIVLVVLVIVAVIVIVVKPFGKSEQAAWDSTLLSDTKTAYSEFLNDFPSGQFASAATDSLNSKDISSKLKKCDQWLLSIEPYEVGKFSDAKLKNFPAMANNIGICDSILSTCSELNLGLLKSTKLKDKYSAKCDLLNKKAGELLIKEATQITNALQFEIADLSLMLGIENNAASVKKNKAQIQKMEKDDAYRQYFDRLALVKDNNIIGIIQKQKATADLMNDNALGLLKAWMEAIP